MKSLQSPTIRTIWYAIWLALVVAMQKLENWCLTDKGLNYVYVAIFVTMSVIFLYLMRMRYHHEEQAFVDRKQSLHAGIEEYFSLLAFAVLAISVFLMAISYLKARGAFPDLNVNTDFLDRGKQAVWFDILASSLLVSVAQQFVTTGFFFNYFWRGDTLLDSIGGLISSGILFGLLNMEVGHFINFFIYFAIGCLLAIIYLATQNFRISVMMGIFVALLRVILI